MRKDMQKGSTEWIMFRDFWLLCCELWEPEDNDEYWEQVIKTTNEFYEKYKGNNKTFVQKISLALVDTLDEKAKQAREDSKP